KFRERVPMPVKQSRKDFRFHFALLHLFVTLLVARVIFAIRINRGREYDVLAVRRPDPAIRSGRDLCHLMRLPDEHSVAGVKVAHPDLRRISGFRSPDESFAVWRKPRALLM